MNRQTYKPKLREADRGNRRTPRQLHVLKLRHVSDYSATHVIYDSLDSSSHPVSAEEIARRQALLEEVLAERAKMPPLGISTEELIRQERRLASGSSM